MIERRPACPEKGLPSLVFNQSVRLFADGLTWSSGTLRLGGAGQVLLLRASPNRDPSTSCFTAAISFCSWKTVFSLRRTCPLFCPNNSILDSSVQRTLLQKCWSLSQFSLANVRRAFMFLLESKEFLLAHLPCAVPFGFPSAAAGACCRSCGDVLGGLKTSLSTLRAAPRVKWPGLPDVNMSEGVLNVLRLFSSQ